jgi:hypothetical protein
LLLYFAKLGIRVVFSELPTPLKGLSKDDEIETSEMERKWLLSAVQTRTAGNWCAVHVRASARVVVASAGIADAWERRGGWKIEALVEVM